MTVIGRVLARAARILVVGCLLAAAASVAPTSVPSVDAACGVSIYRIYYDSPGSDTGSNSSLNAEWIQLRNGCTAAKSLTNWTIKDAAGHTYKFGTYALGAGSTVKIHTGQRHQCQLQQVLESGLVHLE